MDGNDIFIPGQQYRIHTKKQSYDNDKLGIFVRRNVHGYPTFNNVNMRDPESGKRHKQDDKTPISFPSTTHHFYKSGKAIAAAKVLESHGVQPFMLNGYGGSRRIKRRRIRTVKRR
jgi:hypothetical protein